MSQDSSHEVRKIFSVQQARSKTQLIGTVTTSQNCRQQHQYTMPDFNDYKPVVEVARDVQCCIQYIRVTQAVVDRHTDGQMDGQTLCNNKG